MEGGFLAKPPLQCHQLPGEAMNPVAAVRRTTHPALLPCCACAFPKPTDVSGEMYEWAPCRTLCGNSQPRALLSTQPTEDTCSYPSHPFLGSKRSPQSRLCPTHSIWKVTIRAGRATSLAALALLGITRAAASPGGVCPAQPLAGCPAPGRGLRQSRSPGQ